MDKSFGSTVSGSLKLKGIKLSAGASSSKKLKKSKKKKSKLGATSGEASIAGAKRNRDEMTDSTKEDAS